MFSGVVRAPQEPLTGLLHTSRQVFIKAVAPPYALGGLILVEVAAEPNCHGVLNHNPDTGWPPDMGYWMGYRIDQAFYARGRTRRRPCEPCWGVTDFKAYLKASGYPVRREPCVPEKPAAPAN